MRRRIRGSAAALLCLAIAGAFRPAGEPLKLRPESRLWFEGKSTVRDWSCKATAIEAAIEATIDASGASGASAVAGVLKGQKSVGTATLTFPTAKLDCANGTMNGHMMNALAGEQNPAIVFTLTSYELNAAAPVTGTLRGTLSIRGVTKPVTMAAEFAAGTGGALRVTGAYPLKMTDWQVPPPKLMMGTLKVNEMITVHFDLQLQP